MSDDPRNPGDPAGPRRRPPPPTIDLTATEIPGAAGAGKDPQNMAEADRPPEQGPDRPGTDSAGTVPPEPVSGEGGTAEGAPSDAGSAAPGTPPAPQAPPPRSGKFASLARGIPWAAVGGGIAGAMMVLALAAGLRSVFVQPGETDVDERLARVEAQVRDLAARPAPASVTPKALDDLAARVARLERTPPHSADAAVDNRLSALEAATKSLADGVADLNRRADESAAALRDVRSQVEAAAKQTSDLTRQASAQPPEVTRADLDQLGRRIAALDAATASLKAAVGKVGEPGRATRLAVLAFALDNAVERGAPYAAELAAVRASGIDARMLDPLQPFAAHGVPSVASLARGLAALAPTVPGARPGAPPAGGGILDRLQANAERLVRIRPVNEPQGDAPAAILGRMQAKIAEGDVAGALGDAARLPADARAAVDGWVKTAAARQAAIAAAQRLSADTLAALARGPSQGDQQK